MKILVTGTAGFIGFYVAQRLAKLGFEVIGVDNINTYYDTELKHGRLRASGIETNALKDNQPVNSTVYANYSFIKLDISDRAQMENLFATYKFDVVCHLAAQAGVRYSITNPHDYALSNLSGFLNILEGCRTIKVKHLVYASSSSVYGLNSNTPFSVHHGAAHPVSLYAASKKSNEMMAHSYSHLYQIPTTGLRFFTVYGPWGRPDMAYFKFADAIIKGDPIDVYNNGDMQRDFTYVDDIVEGIIRVLDKPAQSNPAWNSGHPDPATSSAPYRLYNIGNSQPVKLMKFIEALENSIGKKALINFLPMQAGDVLSTDADMNDLETEFNYQPQTNIQDGIGRFVAWFKDFYKV
ncbi:NAD-dependent epimerase [Mucilaginibacter aquatilis]|uniref:NAD-dependent epimerase/dehydratase family protein n=1 Tax=Mucilaginibacter aquatilis TaxID=1517760 RepID=A0A6I4IPP7_9SPHI|nr:NAD-dependent epimerase [Mucilaginibacter aquatilis]MVN89694.1 NAD-dependent epimerase/dehydratase family protein [Mucilaginibacter aquatilis]